MTTKTDSFQHENVSEPNSKGFNKLVIGLVVLNVFSLSVMSLAMFSNSSISTSNNLTSMYMWNKEEKAMNNRINELTANVQQLTSLTSELMANMSEAQNTI